MGSRPAWWYPREARCHSGHWEGLRHEKVTKKSTNPPWRYARAHSAKVTRCGLVRWPCAGSRGVELGTTSPPDPPCIVAGLWAAAGGCWELHSPPPGACA